MIAFVYGGIIFSVLSRVMFAILLYYNQSRKLMSLTVCLCNVISNGFWWPYLYHLGEKPLLIRSTIEIIISSWGVLYITHNRLRAVRNQDVKPTTIHLTS